MSRKANLERQGILDDYKSSLNDLTFNSKPMINVLTMLAEENEMHADGIARVIRDRIKMVDMKFKMPALYLLDSILKNVGGDYINIFTRYMVDIFTTVFHDGDEKIRMALYKLRNTWTQYFPGKFLYELDLSVKELDPNWPVNEPPSSPTSIHINPRFLVKQNEQTDNQIADETARVARLRAQQQEDRLKAEEQRIQEQLKKLQEEQLKLQRLRLEEERIKNEELLRKQMEDRERLMEQQQKQIDALKKQNEPTDPRLKAPSASAQRSESPVYTTSSVSAKSADPRLAKRALLATPSTKSVPDVRSSITEAQKELKNVNAFTKPMDIEQVQSSKEIPVQQRQSEVRNALPVVEPKQVPITNVSSTDKIIKDSNTIVVAVGELLPAGSNMDKSLAPSSDIDLSLPPSKDMDKSLAPSKDMDQLLPPSKDMDRLLPPSNDMDQSLPLSKDQSLPLRRDINQSLPPSISIDNRDASKINVQIAIINQSNQSIVADGSQIVSDTETNAKKRLKDNDNNSNSDGADKSTEITQETAGDAINVAAPPIKKRKSDISEAFQRSSVMCVPMDMSESEGEDASNDKREDGKKVDGRENISPESEQVDANSRFRKRSRSEWRKLMIEKAKLERRKRIPSEKELPREMRVEYHEELLDKLKSRLNSGELKDEEHAVLVKQLDLMYEVQRSRDTPEKRREQIRNDNRERSADDRIASINVSPIKDDEGRLIRIQSQKEMNQDLIRQLREKRMNVEKEQRESEHMLKREWNIEQLRLARRERERKERERERESRTRRLVEDRRGRDSDPDRKPRWRERVRDRQRVREEGLDSHPRYRSSRDRDILERRDRRQRPEDAAGRASHITRDEAHSTDGRSRETRKDEASAIKSINQAKESLAETDDKGAKRDILESSKQRIGEPGSADAAVSHPANKDSVELSRDDEGNKREEDPRQEEHGRVDKGISSVNRKDSIRERRDSKEEKETLCVDKQVDRNDLRVEKNKFRAETDPASRGKEDSRSDRRDVLADRGGSRVDKRDPRLDQRGPREGPRRDRETRVDRIRDVARASREDFRRGRGDFQRGKEEFSMDRERVDNRESRLDRPGSRKDRSNSREGKSDPRVERTDSRLDRKNSRPDREELRRVTDGSREERRNSKVDNEKSRIKNENSRTNREGSRERNGSLTVDKKIDTLDKEILKNDRESVPVDTEEDAIVEQGDSRLDDSRIGREDIQIQHANVKDLERADHENLERRLLDPRDASGRMRKGISNYRIPRKERFNENQGRDAPVLKELEEVDMHSWRNPSAKNEPENIERREMRRHMTYPQRGHPRFMHRAGPRPLFDDGFHTHERDHPPLDDPPPVHEHPPLGSHSPLRDHQPLRGHPPSGAHSPSRDPSRLGDLPPLKDEPPLRDHPFLGDQPPLRPDERTGPWRGREQPSMEPERRNSPFHVQDDPGYEPMPHPEFQRRPGPMEEPSLGDGPDYIPRPRGPGHRVRMPFFEEHEDHRHSPILPEDQIFPNRPEFRRDGPDFGFRGRGRPPFRGRGPGPGHPRFRGPAFQNPRFPAPRMAGPHDEFREFRGEFREFGPPHFEHNDFLLEEHDDFGRKPNILELPPEEQSNFIHGRPEFTNELESIGPPRRFRRMEPCHENIPESFHRPPFERVNPEFIKREPLHDDHGRPHPMEQGSAMFRPPLIGDHIDRRRRELVHPRNDPEEFRPMSQEFQERRPSPVFFDNEGRIMNRQFAPGFVNDQQPSMQREQPPESSGFAPVNPLLQMIENVKRNTGDQGSRTPDSQADSVPEQTKAPQSFIGVRELFQQLVSTGVIPTPDAGHVQKSATPPPTLETLEASIPEIKFVMEDLKKRHVGVINTLYIGSQCSSCGLRYPEKEKQLYRDHLDWHFRVNRREKENKKSVSRPWFYSIEQWSDMDDVVDLEESAKSNFFEAEAKVDKPSLEVGDGSCSVLLGPDDSFCDVCFDPFEQFWDENLEEWRYKDAIRVNGKTYHRTCYSDMEEAGFSSTSDQDFQSDEEKLSPLAFTESGTFSSRLIKTEPDDDYSADANVVGTSFSRPVEVSRITGAEISLMVTKIEADASTPIWSSEADTADDEMAAVENAVENARLGIKVEPTEDVDTDVDSKKAVMENVDTLGDCDVENRPDVADTNDAINVLSSAGEKGPNAAAVPDTQKTLSVDEESTDIEEANQKTLIKTEDGVVESGIKNEQSLVVSHDEIIPQSVTEDKEMKNIDTINESEGKPQS